MKTIEEIETFDGHGEYGNWDFGFEAVNLNNFPDSWEYGQNSRGEKVKMGDGVRQQMDAAFLCAKAMIGSGVFGDTEANYKLEICGNNRFCEVRVTRLDG